MPKLSEECGGCLAEEGFPQKKTRQCEQIKTGRHQSPAQTESGKDPAEYQLQGHEKLAQKRKSMVQRAQKISRRSQQDPCQKASCQPFPDDPRTQRHSPRFLRGSA